MPEKKLYKGYDVKELNAQYDCRTMVPEHANIYAKLKEQNLAVLSEYEVRLDISYGHSKEETLDIYLPANSNHKTAPINIYLHGGYWHSRNKSDFSFLAKGLVPSGAILIIVNYALIPSVDLDEIVRQSRIAVAWSYRNALSFGGDKDKIYVSGHSAGGHLTAMMMATNWSAFESDLPITLVKGGTAISGIYDLTPISMSFMQKTLSFTSDQISRNSPEFLLPMTSAPIIMCVGGDESDEFQRQSEALSRVWGGRTECALIKLEGVNHFTVLGEFANQKSILAQAIQKQMGLN
jgi:arylformamidase